jgi:dihydroorotate dehydrogenase (fumarate)
MDLRTRYLGLTLQHPFMVGASPFGATLDAVRRIEDGGSAAIVLHSLFEEQITLEAAGDIYHMDPEDPQFAEVLRHFPRTEEYRLSPDQYLEHLSRVKAAVSVPVIASLNGTTGEAWLRFARAVEQAGADALELNMYQVVADVDESSAAVETRLRDIIADLKNHVKLPIAVKLSPYFTAFGHLAHRLDREGVDGLVLFNRFYQPDIDIEAMAPVRTITLSTNAELRLRLRWMALLYRRVNASLALTGGVAEPDDGVKALLAGADVVQMVSAILRNGPGFIHAMRQRLIEWMEAKSVGSVDEMRGLVSAARSADPDAFERSAYIRTLAEWTAGS